MHLSAPRRSFPPSSRRFASPCNPSSSLCRRIRKPTPLPTKLKSPCTTSYPPPFLRLIKTAYFSICFKDLIYWVNLPKFQFFVNFFFVSKTYNFLRGAEYLK